MSAPYAQAAPSAARSVAAQPSAIMCLPSILSHPNKAIDWCGQINVNRRAQTGSIEAKPPAPALVSWTRRWPLTRNVEEPADQAFPIAHGGDFTAQPSIKAETAAGVLDHKQEHQQGQEHVRPGPLGRIDIEAKPKLQRIGDGQHAHQSHRKPEDHRTSEC